MYVEHSLAYSFNKSYERNLHIYIKQITQDKYNVNNNSKRYKKA